jgi:hypothetical protein
VAEQQVASQGGFSPLELISYLVSSLVVYDDDDDDDDDDTWDEERHMPHSSL